jgi:uncharacterized protein (DUF1684 family)
MLYLELCSRAPDAETALWFRAQRDLLFREHPQSPIERAARDMFEGLVYWPYNEAGRVMARFIPSPPSIGVTSTANGAAPLRLIGSLHFELLGRQFQLNALWFDTYAGGLFVPFRDATSGTETYGGGRYLLDSAKSADLGADDLEGLVVLDFNYAYHPSCAYDPVWPCPLALPENNLPVAVRFGERLYSGARSKS